MFLSVIIPAYNEEKRLPETLIKVRAYLGTQKYDWEVIIINDGSVDQTPQLVEAFIKGWPQFRLINNKQNQGKGAVVKQGMLAATGDWRLFMDADNSTDISEIEKLFDSPFDVIIGSRYLNKNSIKIKQPISRRLASRIGNFLIRRLLGLKIKDTQCGFKLFSAKAAKAIFPLQTINRWGFDVELLVIAKRKNLSLKEVAVSWYNKGESTVKKTAIFQTLKELFVIRKNAKLGLYS